MSPRKGKGKGEGEGQGKGKGRAEEVIDLDGDDEGTDDEVVCLDSPVTGNGSGSTVKMKTTRTKNKVELKPSIKKTENPPQPPQPPAGKKAVKRPRETTPEDPSAAKLFIASSTPSKRRVPPGQTMGLQSPGGDKVKDEPLVKVDPSAAAAAAPTNPFAPPLKGTEKALELDTDPMMFDPAAADVGGWRGTGGRLPYEVLVAGVYLPVAGTRSRLAIGRVICK